ncbi:MAG TPA: DUF6009 family protein [Abditibacteriaceae bacterium]|jgi:hypothetical protein
MKSKKEREERRLAEQLKVKQWLEWYNDPNPLKDELEIVWLYDPAIFPFVRASYTYSYWRERPLKRSEDYPDSPILVAYAVLKPPPFEAARAPVKQRCPVRRREFLIMPFDFDRPGNWPPSEGVDPFTIKPTERGYKTTLCYQAPTHRQRAVFASILNARQAKRDAKRQSANLRQRRRRKRLRAEQDEWKRTQRAKKRKFGM